ncbi:hypothetical protein PV325_005490 [Microctonus aethiopoides]|nr:hypothetical protein PV325_005490 [Microctonus aethiopoides]
MGVSCVLKQDNFHLVLVLIMTVSMVKSLSGDNLCHRVENYTVTVREEYREPVVVQTFTWCISMPPRCAKSRTEMRLRYRIKSQQKQRNVSECCSGFIKQRLPVEDQFVELCVPISNCKSGYIGDNCDIQCPTDTWGIQCMQMCDCGAYATCNPINGSCNCAPGWQGAQCEKKCEPGKWGLNCAYSCSCTNIFAHCHHVSGDCLLDNNDPIDKLPSSSSSTVMSNLSNDETLETLSSSHPPVYSTDTTSVNFIQTTSTPSNRIASVRNEITLDSTLHTALINAPINKYEYTNTGKLFVAKVENSTSVKPLVAVVHVSGKSILGHENMIRTSIGNADSLGNGEEKETEHATLDIVALIVIGSIIFLGVITLAVLAIFHIRSRLYETIRLAIYDAEKPDTRTNMTLPREKINNGRNSTLNCNSELLAPSCGYETPRCIVPERRDTTLPRPNSLSIITRESTYSNQYPNIQLFSNLRELLEANYDRPPPTATTFQQETIDTDVEHLYDEIPLQSTMFAAKAQEETTK